MTRCPTRPHLLIYSSPGKASSHDSSRGAKRNVSDTKGLGTILIYLRTRLFLRGKIRKHTCFLMVAFSFTSPLKCSLRICLDTATISPHSHSYTFCLHSSFITQHFTEFLQQLLLLTLTHTHTHTHTLLLCHSVFPCSLTLTSLMLPHP